MPMLRAGLAVLGLIAATAATAQDLPNLTVYTYDSFASDYGPGPQLKAGFEKTCGCTLTFVAVDSAIGALRRVQLEGATTSADIVLGLDTAVAGEARATGLFAPHGLDLTGFELPFPADPDFVPYDYGFFAFVYDTDKVSDPPASFEELIAKPASFKVVIEDPRSDTPGLGLVLWIEALYGERAPEIWRGLKPHVLTVARSWSDAYGLFVNGEADMVLSYTTSPAYHLIAENDPTVAAADFGAHYAQIEVAGILKSSRHQELAKQFLTYLVSPEAQAVIPTTNWMYPVNGTPPDGFAPPPGTVLLTDEATVTANKDAWIEAAFATLQ
jgi:thiamine transport system substrate-binding protein